MVSHTECGGTAFTSRDGTDDFGRKTFDEVQTGIGFITRQFTYHKGKVTDEHKNNEKLKSSPVTNLVKRIEMSDGRILSYEYDKEERIRKVTESNDNAPDTVVSETVYTYDSQGQLIKEIRDGVTVNEMTYDKYGNIKTRNGIAYTYGNSVWKDQLTGYGDKSISYDSQGNPVSYLGHTLTWEKGRQLKKFDSNTYTYNAGGIRNGKTVSGVKHSYRLDGTKILSEKWGSNTLTPLYDNKDDVCGIVFNGASYYFLKNLQGDVISILDSCGNRVAEYLYDAWGVCTVVNDETEEGIATVNPFRYRSYYYDSETGMYYLLSRYYDPVVGRFVNADDASYVAVDDDIISSNLYTYCKNNVVNITDTNGFFGTPLQWLCAVIGGILGWVLGDFIARAIGFNPKGALWKRAGYWTVRGLVVAGGSILGYIAGTKLLNLITKLVYSKGIEYKLPSIVRWFLGIPTESQFMDTMYVKYYKHIFSRKHIDEGLLKIGTSKRQIFDRIFCIVQSCVPYAQNGSNEIHTIINGYRVTIRFYIYDGDISSINAFMGWASKILGKLIRK